MFIEAPQPMHFSGTRFSRGQLTGDFRFLFFGNTTTVTRPRRTLKQYPDCESLQFPRIHGALLGEFTGPRLEVSSRGSGATASKAPRLLGSHTTGRGDGGTATAARRRGTAARHGGAARRRGTAARHGGAARRRGTAAR
ncbi:hypothetical protein AB0939_28915, partial [Streptomyces sp. NPDC006990]|uniref:hypothetical protein n=1 Tax=Streptomyces sp. NPDC006990 TaxID=3154481 RepID=UPI0034513020